MSFEGWTDCIVSVKVGGCFTLAVAVLRTDSKSSKLKWNVELCRRVMR